MILLFPIIYFINLFESRTINSLLIYSLILIVLLISFISTSIILFIISFELLIILLFILLLIYIPSYYRIRTSFWLFIFSLIGSLFFILSIILFISSSTVLLILLLIPFIIKLPSFHSIIDYLKFIVKLIYQFHYYWLDYYLNSHYMV